MATTTTDAPVKAVRNVSPPSQDDIMSLLNKIEYQKTQIMNLDDFNKTITLAIRKVGLLCTPGMRSRVTIEPIRSVRTFKDVANSFYDNRIAGLTHDTVSYDNFGLAKIKYLADDNDDISTDLAASSLIKLFPSATSADVEYVCRWTQPRLQRCGIKVSALKSAAYAVFYAKDADDTAFAHAVSVLLTALQAAKKTVPKKTVPKKRAGDDVAPAAKRPCM